MSFEAFSLASFITLASIAGIRVIYGEVCGFSTRTANDVPPFLLKMDMEALYGTFHPEAEDNFRNSLPWPEFKRVQWKRFHLAIHYCNQISHNAWVFSGWTRHERREGLDTLNKSLRKTVRELNVACLQTRLSSFVIRTRLHWWLVRTALLPFAPPPSFNTLVRVGSSEMISFYQNVIALAEVFSLAYGEDYHQKLMEAL